MPACGLKNPGSAGCQSYPRHHARPTENITIARAMIAAFIWRLPRWIIPPPLSVHHGSYRDGRCAWSQTAICHASNRLIGHHRRSTLSNAAFSIEQVVLTPATDERCLRQSSVFRRVRL